MQKIKSKGGHCKLSWTTPIFLLRYPKQRKVPTNPRWCPYEKDSPLDGQAPQMSNFIESRWPSRRASGAPILAPLKRSSSPSLLSFQPKCRRPHSLWYTVVAAPKTWLMQSHKTLVPLGTNTMVCARAEGFMGCLNSLTQLGTNLEQALMRSN
jgi:hypothetical protein